VPLPGKVAALLRESRWLVLVALALYLALILFSYHSTDPGWSHSVRLGEAGRGVLNAGGRIGAWLADVLLYLFGLSAWWLVLLLMAAVAWGYRRLDGSHLLDRRPLAIALLGFVLLLLCSSSIEALRLHSLKASLPLAPGGMIGRILSDWFLQLNGFTGSTLVLLTLWGIGASLFTGVSWLRAAELTGTALEWAWLGVARYWSDRRDRQLGTVAKFERKAVVDAKREIIPEHVPIRVEKPVLEIQRSVRAQKEKQAPLFVELPDTPLPPLMLLDEADEDIEVQSADTLDYTSRLIEKKLADFGVQAKVVAAKVSWPLAGDKSLMVVSLMPLTKKLTWEPLATTCN
jgi:S-DNA-T family DNA segregation ATPase FtsK/SpoIIIE